MDYFDFHKSVAVITGCSGGLGEQMARALANQGCDIVLLARREDKLKEIAESIQNEYKVNTYPIFCDVTNTEVIDEVVKQIKNTIGKIDILINNAGTGIIESGENMSDEQFYNDINVDLFGTFRCCRSIAKYIMIPNKYGRIISISSMYGLVGNNVAPCVGYHSAKGGIINMTRALAAEWAKYNITVNAICPGYFMTDLTKSTLETDDFKQYASKTIPLGRYGHQKELDTSILFLASKYSSYVTGSIIPVDGGYTCI